MISTNQDPYASLKIKEFSFFLVARFCMVVAFQIQAVAVAWQVFELTHLYSSLGNIGLAEAVSSISVALYAGHLADIFNRKKIITFCIFGLLICSGILILSNLLIHPNATELKVYTLYGAIFLSGFARGFAGPALFALMPQLLPDKSYYANAVSWNSSFWQTASVLGPAIGGFLYAYTGPTISYLVVFSLLVISFIFMLLVKSRAVIPQKTVQKLSESISTGISFIFSNPIILAAISLDMFAVLFGGAVALLPAFAEEILKVGPEGLGWLKAAQPIGAVTVALFVTYFPLKNGAGKKLLFAITGFGLCMIAFAISKSYYISLFILFLSGMFDSVSVIVRSSLLQLKTPENMKGRVASVNNIFVGSSNEIGAAESGYAAQWLGLVPSVIMGGCVTLLVVLVTSIFAKDLRKLNLNHQIE